MLLRSLIMMQPRITPKEVSMPDLMTIYQGLRENYPMDGWWPAETPFEVVVGAFLTQNTNWTNVEKALANLRKVRALNLSVLAQIPCEELEQLIRPSGFYRQKAARLQNFCRYLLAEHDGTLEKLLQQRLDIARGQLLAQPGIGHETADSILLYAGDRPSFVIDSYTRRLFGRIGILTGGEKYDEIRQIFMAEIPEDVALYKDYHALIVTHCKNVCRKSPRCPQCFFANICGYADKVA